MTQFTHYHILARLHLPYLLKSPADGTFDPHKLTTINASREILVRYLALRGSSTTNNYCRGVDYLMFIAATTLCIAHINSSHWRRLNGQGPHFDFLAHQRPGDIGLMQHALEITRESWNQNGHKADRNIGMILESLLKNEAKAASGSIFSISTTLAHPLADFPGERSNDSNNLSIDIPFVGTIKIEKERASASRSSGSAFAEPPGIKRRPHVTWVQTDYQDIPQLEEILREVHTVLSFITTQSDPENTVQKNLIDAAIQAGVKRFAPSEWATSNFDHMPWYQGKAVIREYLQEINKERKVLEYSLFIPGLFTNYFAHPHPSAKHFKSFETHIDFQNCRALVLEGGEDDRITLTTAQDLASVVVKAIEYEGEWPIVGGITGTELSIRELLEIGERVRGKPFNITTLSRVDLEAGLTKSSWLPAIDHPGMPDAEALASKLTAGMILAIEAGALDTSDEWNRVFPEYDFTQAEEFLEGVWRGRE
ncbi:hypothetical protein PRZ48_007153 [Zasmidium cellare]|uniref:NmrA-like domain-containing protein n=1 Tax=Zasmidium cellare TaxID=395010 RepID=A0ABR0EJK6_ZASCE|nr:hypothetical protein PRZ48_007153 [Zasmidium cellare]